MRTYVSHKLLPFMAMLLVLALGVAACKPPQDVGNPVAQRLTAKAEIAKRGIIRVQQTGGDPGPSLELLHRAKARLDQGDIQGGEALLDRIIALVYPEHMPDVPAGPGTDAPGAGDFSTPRQVTLRGYDDHAMEPFITRDGQYLLWNNSNHPDVNTNLHVARRIDEHTFDYLGELNQLSTPGTDAVASVDRHGNMFYISTDTYARTYRTIFRADFADGSVANSRVVVGDITRGRMPYLSMDAEISADGQTLYYTDNEFGRNGYPKTSNVVLARRHGQAFDRRSDSGRIMANINTGQLEYAPATTEDELTFYFTRASLDSLMTRTGDAEPGIYVATRTSRDEPFGRPLRIDSIRGFVEAPTVAPDGAIYFHRRDAGRFALYRAAPLAGRRPDRPLAYRTARDRI